MIRRKSMIIFRSDGIPLSERNGTKIRSMNIGCYAQPLNIDARSRAYAESLLKRLRDVCIVPYVSPFLAV